MAHLYYDMAGFHHDYDHQDISSNHQPRLYEPRLLTVGNRVLLELAGETFCGRMLGKELSSTPLSPKSNKPLS